MQVTIYLQADAALAFHQRQPPTPAYEELRRTAEELGVALKPVHPGAEDPDLIAYFTIEVSDPATAERVITRFRQCHATKAAYLKPLDEMP